MRIHNSRRRNSTVAFLNFQHEQKSLAIVVDWLNQCELAHWLLTERDSSHGDHAIDRDDRHTVQLKRAKNCQRNTCVGERTSSVDIRCCHRNKRKINKKERLQMHVYASSVSNSVSSPTPLWPVRFYVSLSHSFDKTRTEQTSNFDTEKLFCVQLAIIVFVFFFFLCNSFFSHLFRVFCSVVLFNWKPNVNVLIQKNVKNSREKIKRKINKANKIVTNK